MKTIPLLAFAALMAAGCSTLDSRISSHRSQFDAWPAGVQQKVQAGQVDIGFTQEQVQVALGDPDRTYSRTDAHGTDEVWAYRDHSPVISFGLGMASFGRSSAVGGGVGVTTGGDRYDDKLRVIFSQGRVVALERSTAK